MITQDENRRWSNHAEDIMGFFAYPPKYVVHCIFGDMQSPGICGVYCH